MNKILIALSFLFLTACNDFNKLEKESNASVEQQKESNSVIKSQLSNSSDSLIKETTVSQVKDKKRKIQNRKWMLRIKLLVWVKL